MDEPNAPSLDPILTVFVSKQGGGKDWDYKIETALEKDDLVTLLEQLAANVQQDADVLISADG